MATWNQYVCVSPLSQPAALAPTTAKSGLMWAPGRSCGDLGGRHVARGACRAGGLRLGPVGAAWHPPRPTNHPGKAGTCLHGGGADRTAAAESANRASCSH